MLGKLMNIAVNTGDEGNTSKYIILAGVCVVAIVAVVVIGIMSKKK